jgi:hypothetical protein
MNPIFTNDIHSFKGRELDVSKPVLVYRNLTRKGKVYSIKQSGRVVAHAYRLILKDVDFVINYKAQAKIRLTKQRQVHAYAKGFISETRCSTNGFGSVYITYNPHKNDEFMGIGGEGYCEKIYDAGCVEFSEIGLYSFK